MRSARLSSAFRGSMLAVALAAVLLPSGRPAAQDAPRQAKPPGAILVQAVDTSINPIPAEIVFPAFELAIRLSEEGAILLLNVPDGLYLMQARRLGHRPEWRFVRVTGDTARVEFVLAPADLRDGAVLDALAAWRLREFLRRTVAIPVGSFVTRGEIERRRPRNLVALLGRLADVKVDRMADGQQVLRSRRAPAAQCGAGMLLLVDAALPVVSSLPPLPNGSDDGEGSRLIDALRPERLLAGLSHVVGRDAKRPNLGSVAFDADAGPPSGPDERKPGRRGASLLERIPIDRVAAVEVYPMLEGVPPEFRVVGSECGMVLVWTRSG